MLRLCNITTENKSLYTWAMSLLAISFPPEERRDDKLQLEVMSHPDYRLRAICDDEKPVGVVGYFDTPDFIYFENFCVSPDRRNCGYGSGALKLLTDKLQKPFILEAELPVDEITRRRIEFYKRNGMVENPFDHIQPHYRRDDPDLHLIVLSYKTPLTDEFYGKFKRYLDENVEVKGK